MTYTGRGWTLPASYPIQSVTNANSSVTIDEINSRLGTNYTTSTALTKSQWQDVLQKYNRWIALQRSGLSVSDGGGIQFLDGKWYAGRQEVKFMDLYVAIRVNSLFNQQSATTVILNQIQKRNTRIKQANEFLSQLQAIEPTNTTDTVAKSKLGEICDAFIAKYGYNPFVAFIPVSDKGSISSGTSFKQVQFENWFTELKANISSYQTDNESDQAYLQEITNKRSETTDSISNMIKSISQNNSGVARNLA
jgi:hypothetical protein